jgi:hypothetical protein
LAGTLHCHKPAARASTRSCSLSAHRQWPRAQLFALSPTQHTVHILACCPVGASVGRAARAASRSSGTSCAAQLRHLALPIHFSSNSCSIAKRSQPKISRPSPSPSSIYPPCFSSLILFLLVAAVRCWPLLLAFLFCVFFVILLYL